MAPQRLKSERALASDAEASAIAHVRPKTADTPPAPSPAVQDEPAPNAPDAKRVGTHPRNYRWAELMKRVFLVDVLQCVSCGCDMKVLAAIHPPLAQRILECLGLPPRAPPVRALAPYIHP
jgi:hypothetical protein